MKLTGQGVQEALNNQFNYSYKWPISGYLQRDRNRDPIDVKWAWKVFYITLYNVGIFYTGTVWFLENILVLVSIVQHPGYLRSLSRKI